MSDDRIRVLIIAPMLAVRIGLQTLLSAAETVELVGEAVDFSSLDMGLLGVDVIVLQGNIPQDSFPFLREMDFQTAVLWVSDDPQATATLRAIPCRAWGIVHPDADELLSILQVISLGYIVAPAEIMKNLWVEGFRLDSKGLVEKLTPRENEVLQLLAQGLANKQIARELEISEHTVKFHISSIYGKLNVVNRTEAVRVGLQAGLISL
jgi:DNA-binding NarL/FixJ family response regulator